jgi:GT2 family glycosyltransferase
MKQKDTNYPLVSIITINYNHSDVTAECLDSLRNITYPNYEIIVIDNASPNDDPAFLKEDYPEITYMELPENLGFAGGNNVGIKECKGDYILLLNNDTEVEPDFLEPLVKKCEDNPKIGGVSPKIYYHHTPEMLQFAGFTEIHHVTVRNHAVGFNQMDTGQFEQDSPTYFVHGAAMLIPRKVIEEVGMMADIYFLYYEELDWGYRIRQAGYDLYYVCNSLIHHKESISTGFHSPLQVYYLNRSRILYMRRNIKGWKFFISSIYLIFISIPKNYSTFFFKRKKGLLKAYHQAITWHLKNLFNKEIHKSPQI